MAKKFAKATLLICMFACIMFSACNQKIVFSLYFRVDDNIYAVISTSGREVIVIPEDPVKDDLIFDGWYWDKGVWEKPFTANSLLEASLKSNMSVYAKFVEKPHVCVYSSEWNSDAEMHWHECPCGNKTDEEGHYWSEWVVKAQATIESKELQERSCYTCGYIAKKEIERYAKYTTEYYLQNLEGDNYALEESVSGFAVIGSTVKAEIKKFSHFSVKNSDVEGIVADSNDMVLMVYYNRDVYTVTFDGNGGVLKSGTEVQNVKYEGNAIAPEYTRYGYVFNGFDGSYENIEKNITIRAKWADIQKQNYNMSGVVFEGKEVTYNGEVHSLYIKGDLPEGVTVNYENNTNVNAGTYTVTAKFTGDSVLYNPIPAKTATLIIDKAEYNMSDVRFIDSEKTYTGERIMLNVSGTLPGGVSVRYYNADGTTFVGKADVGVYPVIAKFSGDTKNYKSMSDMTAVLNILPKRLKAPEIEEVAYDILYWTKVENADGYIVRVNSDFIFNTRSTQCDLSKLKNEAGEQLELVLDSKGELKPISVEVMAIGVGNYKSSKYCDANNDYYYIPEKSDELKGKLSELGIGSAYNLIEYDYLDSEKITKNKVLNVGKLIRISSEPICRDGGEGVSQGYSYSSIDEFMSTTKISLNIEKGSSFNAGFLLGSLSAQLNANIDSKYSEYDYNNTFRYEVNKSYKEYAFSDLKEKLIKYCLADGFVKDYNDYLDNRKALSGKELNAFDDAFVKYLYESYGTHVILGLKTGGHWFIDYSISTNKKSVAAGVKLGFNVSSSLGIDQIVETKFNISTDIMQEIEENKEETVTTFRTGYYGGTCGAVSSLSGVDSAVKEWEKSVNTNARPIGFTSDGAISIIDIISSFDNELAEKMARYIDSKADEKYNELFCKYSKKTTIPMNMETENGKNTLVIDLSQYQATGTLDGARYPTFDNNVLTIYSTMLAKSVDEIRIKGAYDKYKTPIAYLTIKLSNEWEKDVKVVLDNVGLYTSNENGLVDKTAVLQDIDVTIETLNGAVIKEYPGYTFINSLDGLNAIRNNPGGKYLLVKDLNLGGCGWKALPTFKGVFDGGFHEIYNFVVNSNGLSNGEVGLGLFAETSSDALICNLIVGKSGFETSVKADGWWSSGMHAGGIVANNNGDITNCYVNNIVIYARALRNDGDSWVNVGGIAGTNRGNISKCFVENSTLNSKTECKFDRGAAHARTGGIVGYNETVNNKKGNISDCLIRKNVISSNASASGHPFNYGGDANAYSAGMVGYSASRNSKFVRLVEYGNQVSANASTDWAGNAYRNNASFFGHFNPEFYEESIPVDLVIGGDNTTTVSVSKENGATYSYAILGLKTDYTYEKLLAVNPNYKNYVLWQADENGLITLNWRG